MRTGALKRFLIRCFEKMFLKSDLNTFRAKQFGSSIIIYLKYTWSKLFGSKCRCFEKVF